MAKQKEEKIFSKDEEAGTLNKIREAAKNIRKFSFINNNLFTTLKTSKKEMLTKEVASITDLISKL